MRQGRPEDWTLPRTPSGPLGGWGGGSPRTSQAGRPRRGGGGGSGSGRQWGQGPGPTSAGLAISPQLAAGGAAAVEAPDGVAAHTLAAPVASSTLIHVCEEEKQVSVTRGPPWPPMATPRPRTSETQAPHHKRAWAGRDGRASPLQTGLTRGEPHSEASTSKHTLPLGPSTHPGQAATLWHASATWLAGRRVQLGTGVGPAPQKEATPAFVRAREQPLCVLWSNSHFAKDTRLPPDLMLGGPHAHGHSCPRTWGTGLRCRAEQVGRL